MPSQTRRSVIIFGSAFLVLIVVVVGLLHTITTRSTGVGATATPTNQAQSIAAGVLNELPTAVAEQTTATATPAPNQPTETATPTTAPVQQQPTATQRPRPTATPTQPTSQPSPNAVGVHLSGTQLVDANGRVIRLIGTNFSRLEYSCSTDHMAVADFQVMRTWGINVVRFPTSSEIWGHCAAYQSELASAVANAEAAGLYVIIDLQWDAPFDQPQDRIDGGSQYPVPDANQDVSFWRAIASLYKQDTRVLFDMMGEPHDVNFATWLNGGPVFVHVTPTSPGYSVDNVTYQSIGMKNLAQIIRSIAPNVIIASGLDYGYDLSGLGQGYALPVSNVMYGTHPFNYSEKQPSQFGYYFGNYSNQYPIIFTEFGQYDCQTNYISQVISYANQHGFSWMFWNWGIGECTGPSVIADWNGDPAGTYGSYLRSQVLAIYHP